jgi:8-oxo-dGTP pyrophosphatase MutT (NUDIX family)
MWRIGLRCAYLVLRVWWWLRRPEVHGAYVAVWQDHRLLLIRNSYRDGVSVPCGAIHRRESSLQAAVRELHEEVGIAVRPDDLVSVGEFVVSFEDKIDHAHFFELAVTRDVCVQIDEREVIHAEFVEEDELVARPLVPHLRAYLEARSQSAR